MASENQLAALESWLKKELPSGMSICEMPGEVCSDALERLHNASEEYKEDKKKYGIVKKVKQEIVSDLKEQGYIDVRISVDSDIEEARAEQKEKEKIDELHKAVFGERAEEDQKEERVRISQDRIREEQVKALEAEARETEHKEPQKDPFGKRVIAEALHIQEEQGLTPKEEEEKEPTQTTVTRLIEKFGELRAMVTESVRENERIPEREKGYAINWISDAVKDALERGGDHEE